MINNFVITFVFICGSKSRISVNDTATVAELLALNFIELLAFVDISRRNVRAAQMSLL